MTKSTIIAEEVAKFAAHAEDWWDEQGPLKTLHIINPARLNFLKSITTLQGARVLDVGCGGGILTESMAKEGALAIGLDVEPLALEGAQEHAGQANIAVDYVCSPLEDYDAPGFDLITCMEMLEHVDHPALVIEHCARLLKPQAI